MEFALGLSVGVLVYMAFVFDVAGFLARDELYWRGLMFTASCFYLVYYYLVADLPLWDAILTNGILAGVNLVMIGVVIYERSTFGMSRDTLDLYRLFPLLSPGQFRRLVGAAERVVADHEITLVTEGEEPDHLYFLLEGPVEVIKAGDATAINPHVFIAEVAYLTGEPASATVRVQQGAVYLRWESGSLRKLLTRAPGLHSALVANLNIDLARKVARSRPLPRAIKAGA